MIRKTIQLGDPLLKEKNIVVDNFSDSKVKQVITDLVDTMRDSDLIGMAAPQIGENYKIFVTEPRATLYRSSDQADELRIYINPKIIFESAEKTVIYEGCGCVNDADEFGPVLRPKIITVEAFDQNGKKFRFKADGILGRVIQHELDHLNGIEFIERVEDKSKKMNREKFLKEIKNSPAQKSASVVTIKEYTLVV